MELDLTTVVWMGAALLICAMGLAGMFFFTATASPAAKCVPEGRPPDEKQRFHTEAAKMAQRLRNWHQDSVDTDRTALRARMESLIETAPRSAIIKGIRELETTAVDILQKHFYPGYAVNRCSTREIIAYLRYHRILDDAGLEMFEQLDRLRTMAYSLSNPVIDPEAASAMLFAAELLEKDLKGFEIALSVAVPFQPLEQATG